MLIRSEGNTYKKLLKENNLEDLDIDTDGYTLVNAITKYINKKIRDGEEYLSSIEYFSNIYDEVYRDNLDIFNWDYGFFHYLIADRHLDEEIDESVIDEFIEENIKNFEISVYENSDSDKRIGYFKGLGESQGAVEIDSSEEINIPELNITMPLFKLVQEIPDSFYDLLSENESLEIDEDILDSIRSGEDNLNYIEIDVYSYDPYGHNGYLQNEEDIKDLYLSFLSRLGLIGIIKSDDNSVWEEED